MTMFALDSTPRVTRQEFDAVTTGGDGCDGDVEIGR